MQKILEANMGFGRRIAAVLWLLVGLAASPAFALTGSGIVTVTNGTVSQINKEKVWLPAAGCNGSTPATFWDLPTSTPAVAACVGTNVRKGVLNWADTGGGFTAQTTLLLPADWTTTGGVDIKLYWTSDVNTGNIEWTVSNVCTAVDATATDDPSFSNSNVAPPTAVPGTAGQVQTTTITGLTTTGCTTATNRLLHLKLFRNGAAVNDTATGATISLIGAELTFRRAQ